MRAWRRGWARAVARRCARAVAWLTVVAFVMALQDCAVPPPQPVQAPGAPPSTTLPPPAPEARAPAGLDAIVAAQIAVGRIPGAVIVAGDAQGPTWRYVAGARTRGAQPEPMTMDTVFDLASLTKVIATTTAVLQLVEAGRLDLDAFVSESVGLDDVESAVAKMHRGEVLRSVVCL